ncbi:MAG: decaprenyl-phosphate phosphoribosyltransferase [Myxococcales bacterium]|nr:decaprenyl-phosphate phosphoribosyltransferase [Myxococcales bacterium]
MAATEDDDRDERDSDAEVPPRGGVVLGLIKTIRPHQWVKNLFVLAPIFFAKNVFQTPLLLRALGAVAAFCLLSGAVYTLNDLVDVEADRVHPKKRFRPIPSGQVPEPVARVFLGVLVVVVFALSAVFLPRGFVFTAAGYFALNVAYSLKLKKIPFLDVACISAGFVLRVLGGGFAIDVKVSWYMFACTALLALFLGFGKRRHEIAQEKAGKQRKALEAYTAKGLDITLYVTGGLTLVTYVAYTLDHSTRAFFKSDQLWMTTPSVVIGVARFLQIVMGHPKAESPTQEMLRDSLFVLNLVAWAVVVVAIVYRIRPT